MVEPNTIMRVARPTDNLEEIAGMYEKGLGFSVLGKFSGHSGFDGVILGHPKHPYHLEFTHHRGTVVGGAPTPDNLIVFYIDDKEKWQRACSQMESADFQVVESYNPYWDDVGRTFQDVDGYRVVLQNRAWTV
ncbi:MAG: VOC family protein [bacterium]|nr:VOC family protein [bacterium]